MSLACQSIPQNSDKMFQLNRLSMYGFLDDINSVQKFTEKSIKDDIRCAFTGSSSPWLNWIYGGFRSGNYEVFLDEKIQLADQQKFPFIALLDATHSPSIGETLTTKGFVNIGRSTGVSYDLSKVISIETNPAVSVRGVTNDEMFQDFVDICSLIFEIMPDDVRRCHGAMYKNLPSEMFRLYVAYLSEEAVGCSIIHMKNENACNNTAGVLTHARNQGVLTKMAVERMLFAQSCGVAYMHSQCLDTSLRIYKKMGFEEFGTYSLYLKAPV